MSGEHFRACFGDPGDGSGALWHGACYLVPDMKTAVSHCGGRIAPVFDVSENILLLESDGPLEKGREFAALSGRSVFERAAELVRLGASVLICGAVSREQEEALRDAGVEVRGFVCGPVELVVSAFLKGRLDDASLMMPGRCCGWRGRRRGCRGGTQTNNTQKWRN